MLEEFVNNKNYLVKQGFGPWQVLDKPIKFDIHTRIQIKPRCEHKNYYNDDGCNYCLDCGDFLKVTSS